MTLGRLSPVWDSLSCGPASGIPASMVRSEVREVPASDKPPQGAHAGMFCKLTERVDCQHLRAVQFFADAFVLFFRHLA